MADHDHDGHPGAQPPLEQTGARQERRNTTAAGLHGIYETAHFGFKEMGVGRTFKTLLMLNQKDGFDCQSCAWPSPDKPKIAEFCENGAKAISDELTHRTIGPEFFAAHSVDELRAQSDHWLNAQGRITYPMVLRTGRDRY